MISCVEFSRYDAVNRVVARHLAEEPLLMPTFADVVVRLQDIHRWASLKDYVGCDFEVTGTRGPRSRVKVMRARRPVASHGAGSLGSTLFLLFFF